MPHVLPVQWLGSGAWRSSADCRRAPHLGGPHVPSNNGSWRVRHIHGAAPDIRWASRHALRCTQFWLKPICLKQGSGPTLRPVMRRGGGKWTPMIRGLPLAAVAPQPSTQGKRNRPEDEVAQAIGPPTPVGSRTEPSLRRTMAEPTAHPAHRPASGSQSKMEDTMQDRECVTEARGGTEGAAAAPIAKRADAPASSSFRTRGSMATGHGCGRGRFD